MCRLTFSITTIASSTTTPTASTNANKDNRLIVIPNAFNAKNVPINETGIVAQGTSVAIPSPKNKKMIITTINAVNKIVNSTSFIDSWMKSASSFTYRIFIPFVILEFISLTLAFTAFDKLIMFASGNCEITTTAAGFPFTRPKLEYDSAPSSTLATSLILTFEPSIFERIIIFSNCFTSSSLPGVFKVICNAWGSFVGNWPSAPVATWVFWLVIAFCISLVETFSPAIFWGSSHILIE